MVVVDVVVVDVVVVFVSSPGSPSRLAGAIVVPPYGAS